MCSHSANGGTAPFAPPSKYAPGFSAEEQPLYRSVVSHQSYTFHRSQKSSQLTSAENCRHIQHGNAKICQQQIADIQEKMLKDLTCN